MKNMPRFFAVLLLCVLLVPVASSASTYAELQEKAQETFAGYSDESLIALYEYARIEIDRRGLQPFNIVNPEKELTVQPGQYTVGKDIRGGEYTVKSNGTFFSLLYVYSPTGTLVATYNVTPSTGIGKLQLENDQKLQFTGDALIFAPYKGLGF